MLPSRPRFSTALAAALAGIAAAVLSGPAASAAPPLTPPSPPPARTGPAMIPAPRVAADALRPGTSYERFLVRYADPATAAQKAMAAGRRAGVGARAGRRLALGATVVHSDRSLGAAQARTFMAALAADPAVRYVEPDLVLRKTDVPGDPLYRAQWHYSEARAGLRLPAAWNYSKGLGATVAVLDTGIAPHSDLASKLAPGYDFVSDAANARDGDGRDAVPGDPGDYVTPNDPNCGDGQNFYPSSWHGTHVAGTVAAAWNNGVAGVGVAPYARVKPVRVLGTCGGTTSDIADAIVWAAGGHVVGVPDSARAQVINMSLGGSGSCTNSYTYQNAINYAVSRGTTVVVSAGNSSADARAYTPASCLNVVAVTALNRQGNRAYYSNFGPAVDVAAPGGETVVNVYNGVLSTLNAGTTSPAGQTSGYYMGTSMAAPHVAGVAALIRAKRIRSPAQVEGLLKRNARRIPGSCVPGCGTGLVDAYASVTAALPYL